MTKKKKKTLKQWIGKIHLWLGLASGLIVLLLSVTGCIYVFSQEITNWQRHDALYVKEVKAAKLPLSTLWKQTQAALGNDRIITGATVYNEPEKSTVFTIYKKAEGEKKLFYFSNIDQYYSIYVDGYTGAVLKIYDEEMDFFLIVKMLHWSLLMDGPVGEQIIGWGTFTFVVMLITGIVLWWPKNKAARKQRFKFQWKGTTKWRRKNYDIHNIFGFYVATLALIIAFTGMVWAFTWFQAVVYVAGSGSTTPPEQITSKSVISKGDKDRAFDAAAAFAMKRHNDAAAFSFSKPADSLAPIDIYVGQYPGVYYVAHQMQFDQYTGKFLAERNHKDKNFGEKLITANYDIHVGAILGIPGKIMAFIASFICGMLPVTGFIIWYGRTYKKTEPKKPATSGPNAV